MSNITIEERLQALESKDKEVLLKSNIEVKFNVQNTQQFDFTRYRKLKFVFFIKDENGNRSGQKIFEIVLIDNNVPTSFRVRWILGLDKP